MNVLQRAREIVASEAASDTRVHRTHTQRQQKPTTFEGDLKWFGEYSDPKEVRPVKVAFGDKQLMTPSEVKLFNRTLFERGVVEYEYQGSLRAARSNTTSAEPDGDPRNWLREGAGVLRYPSGSTYEGGWVGGRREGDGNMSTPKGYRYQGAWREDERAGRGCETFSNKCAMDSNYTDGAPFGEGAFLFSQNPQYRYEGLFLDGLRHGRGSIFYPNGDVFTGSFERGKRHGRGVTTSLTATGREVQYETEWAGDALVSGPTLIDKVRRVQKAVPKMHPNIVTLTPADLSKWKAKESTTDLPHEHFVRIKLGFERLDTSGTGSLGASELSTIWGADAPAMLRKLDTNNNGTVELDEIFAAWYPNVPAATVQRFMCVDINPRHLLRLRGFLAGVKDDEEKGYMQVVGIRAADNVEDRPLLAKHLDQSMWKIGGERFTLVNYEIAKMACDPPHFLDILAVLFPNVRRESLERYEVESIPDLQGVRDAFFRLSGGSFEVPIERFVDAQEEYRATAFAQAHESPSSPDGSPVPPPPPLTREGKLIAFAQPGLFKGQLAWPLGSLAHISVPLLRDVDLFDRRIEGVVSLQQILRYCFPNVPCKRTQDCLTGRRRGGACDCCICTLM